MIVEVVSSQRKKIHPHKFTLWVAIGSILMMFAGLTSAYIVKSSQPGWTETPVPRVFFYSTIIILISSATMYSALKAFRKREMMAYRKRITATAVLGIIFVALQTIGFSILWKSGTTFQGGGAGQFLYIVFGLHALHVLGGVITLLVMFFMAFSTRIKRYNPVPVEIANTYWHFVDALWVYIFVFFLWK